MKRILCLTLTALMLLGCLPGAGATEAEHTHTWTLSGSTPATCAESGIEQWSCSVCGASEGRLTPPLSHRWQYDTVLDAPSCDHWGIGLMTCELCGAQQEYDLRPTGHTWGTAATIAAPTCTEQGLGIRSCTSCGLQEEIEMSAIGHSWGSWIVTQSATPTSSGTQTSTCSSCRATQTREYLYQAPIQPPQPTQPTKPTAPTEPPAPTEPTVPTEAAETDDPTEPTEAAEATEPTEAEELLPVESKNLKLSGVLDEKTIADPDSLFLLELTLSNHESDALTQPKFHFTRQDDRGQTEWVIPAQQSQLAPETTASCTTGGSSRGGFTLRVYATAQTPDGTLLASNSLTYTVKSQGQLVLTAVPHFPDVKSFTLNTAIPFDWTITNVGDASCDLSAITVEVSGVVTANSRKPISGTLAPGASLQGTVNVDLPSFEVRNQYRYACITLGAQGLTPEWSRLVSNSLSFLYERAPQADTNLLKIHLEKTVTEPRDTYSVGQPISFRVLVESDPAFPLRNGIIADPLAPHGIVALGVSLEPGESRVYDFTYTVTPEDLASGIISSTATLMAGSFTSRITRMAACTIAPAPGSEPRLAVQMEVLSQPKNALGYALDETIEYRVVVVNLTGDSLPSVVIDHPLEDAPLAELPLAPGEAKEFTLTHTVTQADLTEGLIRSSAAAHCDGFRGESLTIGVPTLPDFQPGEGLTVITRLMTEPMNGSYYRPGENVIVEFAICNKTHHAYEGVTFADSLTGFSKTFEETLQPGLRFLEYASYTVTAEDCSNGSLDSRTTIAATDEFAHQIENNGITLSVPVKK